MNRLLRSGKWVISFEKNFLLKNLVSQKIKWACLLDLRAEIDNSDLIFVFLIRCRQSTSLAAGHCGPWAQYLPGHSVVSF